MKTNKFSLSHIFLLLFIVSTLFPIVASLIKMNSINIWVGVTDVVLAGIVFVLMMAITSRAREKIGSQAKEKSFSIYQSLGVLPLALLVIFFIFGDAIKWDILLPGLAWRTWVFIYSLPSIIALK